MSTVTASPETTVKHALSRLTRTLPRATATAGVLAAAATTARAAVLRAAGIPAGCARPAPTSGFRPAHFHRSGERQGAPGHVGPAQLRPSSAVRADQ